MSYVLWQLLIWLTFCPEQLKPFSFFYSVFDVDIGDGEPIRKLPYNRSGFFSSALCLAVVVLELLYLLLFIFLSTLLHYNADFVFPIFLRILTHLSIDVIVLL